MIINIKATKELCSPEEMERNQGFCKGFAESVRKMMEKAKGNWGWCEASVTVKFKDDNGKTLTGTDYLGGCSYIDEFDFIKNSGYFADMVYEAIRDAKQNKD
jgi:hypothetical protein